MLLKHGIQTSIVSKKNGISAVSNQSITLHELWLRVQSDEKRAEAIITQHEFENLKNNPATRDWCMANALSTGVKTAIIDTPESASEQAKPNYEKWIPVNHVRVFTRLGKLLGFSDEEIKKFGFSKWYRPWDSQSLMDSVDKLKRKCKS